MDPHAIALLYHTRVVFQVYDALVSRDEKFKLEPALAVAWQMVTPDELALQAAARRRLP
jgi:peptide/nickel transport system substrate-binding protein